MTNPFEEWRGKETPYWLKDDNDVYRQEHLRRLSDAQRIHGNPGTPSKAPNPLARTWHDL